MNKTEGGGKERGEGEKGGERGETHRESCPTLKPISQMRKCVIPKSSQLSEDWSLALQTSPGQIPPLREADGRVVMAAREKGTHTEPDSPLYRVISFKPPLYW